MKAIFMTLLLALMYVTPALGRQSEPYPIISAENADDLQAIATLEGRGVIRQVNWNTAGDRLAVIRLAVKRDVEIWEFRDGAFSRTPVALVGTGDVHEIHWLPDQDRIVTEGRLATGSAFVAVWDAETGDLVETLLDDQMIVTNCCDPPVRPISGWNRDYTAAATLLDSNTIDITGVGEFEFLLPDGLFSMSFVYEPEFGAISDVEWSPGGRYIAVFLADGTPAFKFHLIDAATLETQIMVYGEDYRVCGTAWSPDEMTLAVASEWVSAGSGTYTTNVRFHRVDELVRYPSLIILADDSLNLGYGCISALAWSPDNALFVIGRPSAVRIYETETFTEVASVPRENAASVDWHPSGALLATGDGEGTVIVWGVAASSD